ncbi:MAG: hypothetical protein F6J87_10080 [Spirulina sp. SIO3F2]|nr:hypothetical protein [Spirulina sp. SIO3F2]
MMNPWLWRSLLTLTPLCMSLPAWAADPAAIAQLLETNQCVNCDLSGADLAGANLFGANLVNADLSGADLSGAHLGSANLMDANLTDANLERAYLYEARLDDAVLDRANLSSAYLREQDLSSTSLTGTQFRNANLSYAYLAGVSLAGADLEGVNFKQAHLSGTDAELANIFGVKLTQGVLGMAFCNGFLEDFPLFGSPGSNATTPIQLEEERDFLSFANLADANLTDANLQGANLIGANLRGSNLQGANLQAACMPYAELHGANLTNAQLEGATVNRAMFARTTLQGATGVDLSEAYRSEQERQIAIWQVATRRYVRSAANEQSYKTDYEESEFSETLSQLDAEQPDDGAYEYQQTIQASEGSGLDIVIIEATPRRAGLKGYIAVVVAIVATEEDAADDPDASQWSGTRVYMCESETNTTSALIELPIALTADQPFECPAGTIETSPYGY